MLLIYNKVLQLEIFQPQKCNILNLFRVREMYEGVRDVMKRYRSGKLPKAFKIIPRLRNWEQILFTTEPYNWSAAAMFQGTRYVHLQMYNSVYIKMYFH